MRRLVLLLLILLAAPPGASAAPLSDADYFAIADRMTDRLDHTWDRQMRAYDVGVSNQEAIYAAAMLEVHAVAALRGHVGPARNDERARQLVDTLLRGPSYFTGASAPQADKMFHSPAWLKNVGPGYAGMDKAVDPKVAAALTAAWRARHVLGLPEADAAAIVGQVQAVARTPFFRFPNVRLNQINWNAELYQLAAELSGDPTLLREDYRGQVTRFVAGARTPWLSGGARNLSDSYRFVYQINRAAGYKVNLDSAEYANITLHFLSAHQAALRAGMPPLPEADLQLLRAWVARALFGYWTHSGFLSWDTGLGFKRWMATKTWAYAKQGLLAMATAPEFQLDPRYAAWAKWIYDRALLSFERHDRLAPGLHAATNPKLFGVTEHPLGISSARVAMAPPAANAVRAVAAGLGSAPAAEPPPFYAFDADIGRLSVSTPRYATAIVAVNRGAFPYGGLDLARLSDADGDPLTGIGGRPPAALGMVVTDGNGWRIVAGQAGRRHGLSRTPVVLGRSPDGRVTHARRLPDDPDAGPFIVLEAHGSRRRHGTRITSRYVFRRHAIHGRWNATRARRRPPAGTRVLFPSWGAGATVEARMADGRVIALGRGCPVPLAGVASFRVRSEHGSYVVTPSTTYSGSARTIRPSPQPTAPSPGPTLEITLGRTARFRERSFSARIAPAAGGGVAAQPGAQPCTLIPS